MPHPQSAKYGKLTLQDKLQMFYRYSQVPEQTNTSIICEPDPKRNGLILFTFEKDGKLIKYGLYPQKQESKYTIININTCECFYLPSVTLGHEPIEFIMKRHPDRSIVFKELSN